MSTSKTKRGRGRSGRGQREPKRYVRSAGARVGRHLSPRGADILGIGLVVLAILSVLGLWFGSGGPFGNALRVVVLGAFGPVGYTLPVIALYWAVLLIRNTAQEDRGRMLVGLTIGGLGVLALA